MPSSTSRLHDDQHREPGGHRTDLVASQGRRPRVVPPDRFTVPAGTSLTDRPATVSAQISEHAQTVPVRAYQTGPVGRPWDGGPARVGTPDFERLPCVKNARREVRQQNVLVDRLRVEAALAVDERSASVLRTKADQHAQYATKLLEEIRQVAELDQVETLPDGDLHGVSCAPALPAYRRGRQLWVWCDHESTWHTHGIACDFTCGISEREDFQARQRGELPLCLHRMGHGNGDRAPHCRCPYSPLSITGYVLIEDGMLTPEILEEHGRILDRCSCRKSPIWRHAANQEYGAQS